MSELTLFDEDDFVLQLEQLRQQGQQNLQAQVKAAAQQVWHGKINNVLGDAFIILTSAVSLPGFAFLVGTQGETAWPLIPMVTGFGGLAAGMFIKESKSPTKWRRIQTPKLDYVAAKLEVSKDGTVTATVTCNDNALKTLQLGKHDKEEIARKFALLEQACLQINEDNQIRYQQLPALLAQYNITAAGKIADVKDPRVHRLLRKNKPQPQPQLQVDHQALQIQLQKKEKQEQLLQDNLQLVKALQPTDQ